MKLYKFFIPLLAAVAMLGCKEDPGLSEPLSKDKVKPGTLSSVTVTNKSGAAKISYKIPSDNDLLYVKAEYEIRPGVTRQVKASYSNDSLIVDGFGESKPYQISLYAVDKAENVSEPVNVTVTPLTPPFVTVFNNLILRDNFGGVNIAFSNPTGAELAIIVLTPNNNENLPIETYYTKAKDGNFSIRGYEPVPRKFGAYVRDKYGNLSDTVYKEITPLFETLLDRFKFKPALLPTDAPEAYGWSLPFLWDNAFGEGKGFHTAAGGAQLPLWFTIDLGVTAKLSRFKEFQRATDHRWIFGHGNLRLFEVWGTTNPPADGSFNNWVKLGSFESLKPSGLPYGQLSNEDVTYAQAGEEFDCDPTAPPVRYIRIKALQNWSNTDFIHIMELQFWGSPK